MCLGRPLRLLRAPLPSSLHTRHTRITVIAIQLTRRPISR
ncbi:unnamed protein product [Callosobruchus maculatus]|uniref:Uncharacterized protein n=1 Tax=Callosobruchus maculatus TaxID=64391 RepID=A0A653BT09_CALMS|nr:unnamed protein product [Callosobruchus maculatus]